MAFGIVLSLLLFFIHSTVFADSVFRCRMNAHSSRDFVYDFGTQSLSWCGGSDDCGSKASFTNRLFPKPDFKDVFYREMLISVKENSKIVVVKGFWLKDFGRKPFEFDARVVSRESSFIIFINETVYGNGFQSYLLNLEYKKLVSASVSSGDERLNAGVDTYDCE